MRYNIEAVLTKLYEDKSLRTALAITQICSASLSLIASSCIVIMIGRSSRGLSSPFRRIIFALSMSEVLQSLAMVTGPFSVPHDARQAVVGMKAGTTLTCEVNGFAMVFGNAAVPMYTCLLCYYYYCKLKKNMTDTSFQDRIEAKAHIGILTWNLAVGFVGIITENINASPLGYVCTFSTFPVGCVLRGDCNRGQNSRYYLIICAILVPFISFIGVFMISAMTVRHAIRKGRIHQHGRGQRKRAQPANKSDEDNKDHHCCSSQDPNNIIIVDDTHWKSDTTSFENDDATKKFGEIKQDNHSCDLLNDSNATGQSKKMMETDTKKIKAPSKRPAMDSSPTMTHAAYEEADAFRIYKREILLQAILYAASFILVYSNIFLKYILTLIGFDSPNYMRFLVRLLYPLGGFFNVMIWARPNVVQLRKRYPAYNSIHALYLVLKAGGKVPNLPNPQ